MKWNYNTKRLSHWTFVLLFFQSLTSFGATVLISSNAVWQYLDDGSDLGTAWRMPAFNAGAWASGPAELGYGDNDEATVVNSGPGGARFITTYFRHTFHVANAAQVTSLTAIIKYDDGAVVYLNGTEAFRVVMPPGPVTSLTLAATTVGDDAISTSNINSGLLVEGDNLLAVEVHQASAASSDLSFQLQLLDNTLPDSDNDGLPDSWEQSFGLDPFDPSDALSDLDGDGHNNRQEYVAETDPTDPGSNLHLINAALGNNDDFSFQFPTRAGLQYVAEHSTDLSTWTDLATVTGTGLPIMVTHGGAAAEPEGYYRVRLSGAAVPVSSVNEVGFINIYAPPGLSTITPQLLAANNTVAFLFPAPPDGTHVLKDGSPPNQFFEGFGWDNPNMILPQGEPFTFYNPLASPLLLSFVGEVVHAPTDQQFAIALNDTVSIGMPASGAGLLEMAGSHDTYTFSGQAGQIVYLEALSGNQNLGWSLLDPQTNILNFVPFDSDLGRFTLNNPGTYRVVVGEWNPGGSGPYSFKLWATTNQAFAISFNTTVTNNAPSIGAGLLETPGSEDVYTFSAQVGQSIYLEALSGSQNLGWSLVDPQTNFLNFVPFNFDLGRFTLTNSGTYRVVVGEWNPGASGPYSFRISGAPRVTVNGRAYLDNLATVTNSALLRLESSVSNAIIRYTLNGAPPSSGAFYNGPLLVTQAVVVRAMAFNVAGVASPEADPMQVLVIAPPVFLLHPQNQLAGAGEDVTFAALVAGLPVPALQWLGNGALIAGATNATLQLRNVLPGPPLNFALAASNAFGVVTSAVARLDVLGPPTIVAQPASVVVAVGGTATFSVSAFGPPPVQFQWRKNGVNIENATSSTLSITPVQFEDGATYTVIIATPGGTLISNPALLAVTVPSPPANDNFDAASPLSGANGSATGTNNFTSREVNEPLHAGKPGSNSVWYIWTAPTNGIVTMRTVGSTFDTLLGVYVGTNMGSTVTVASDEDSGGFLTSKVRFNATNGVTYHIAIDGFNGAQGSFILRWELIVTNATLPEIACSPEDRTVLAGQDANFRVTARGAALTYQWFFNGAPITEATSASYTRSNAQPEHVGYYSVRVSNSSLEFIESAAAILELGPFPEQQSRDKTDDVSVSCPGGLRPAGAAASSVAIGSIGYQVLVSISTNNAIDCNTTFCGGIPTGTRYLELSPSASGTFLLDTAGSASRTKLWICDAGTSRLSPRTFIKCDVDSAPDGRSLVRFAAVAGRNYQVYVARLDEVVGVLRLNWKLGLPPALASLSSDRFVAEGAAMTLTVEATNMVALGVATALPPPTYEWFFNETLIATGPSVTLPQMRTSLAGTYRVVAANDLGATSAVVRVEVHGETSRTVVNTGARAELFAADTSATCGGVAPTYQWRRNGLLLPGETQRSLLLPATQAESTGEYTVTISNCFGTISYSVAHVAVTVDVGFQAERMSNGQLLLRWQTIPGKHYRVEFRPSLDTSTWTSLQPDITAAGFTEQVMDPLGPAPRYYRIVLVD